MPIGSCLFCNEERVLGLIFRVCDACWQAEPEPRARLDRVIEERGLVAKPGSLVYRGKPRPHPPADLKPMDCFEKDGR